jgi:rhamnose utilization protein RhaD (predicted bifunctional aldolase and dehydrogenase)/NAD(P)-dependent dehydrogenase (short-subunit alcohol dehydrogenase family)
MNSRWSQPDADRLVETLGPDWGADLALRTYSSRLLGADPSLVLHGGGNTSVKSTVKTVFGGPVPAIFVKASGFDMATIGPEGHPPLDLSYLRTLRALSDLDDVEMGNQLRTHLFRGDSAAPSIEALVHAFLPGKYLDHTHADAVLALTNQEGGASIATEALGDDVVVVDYVTPGFALAKAAAEAFDAAPGKRGMVWLHHGILTWGATARESYEAMIAFVSRAERFLASRAVRKLVVTVATALDTAHERVRSLAPVVRGLLALPTGDADRPHRRVILQPLVTREALDVVDAEGGRSIAVTPPLTSDHLIRTRPLPVWIDAPAFDDADRFHAQLTAALRTFAAEYEAYVARHAPSMPRGMAPFDALPRVVLIPGVGALCAGPDLAAATVARDITAHTLAVKARIAAMGSYRALSESECFRMEYHVLQHAKLRRERAVPLTGHVALVTGAAGAIGSGVCRVLLEQGACVAATDLAGAALDTMVADLREDFGASVVGAALDVTDPRSVAGGFGEAIAAWGGVDLVIVNAGIAHVAPLAELDLDAFRHLERVNVEGTLLVLAESARHFKRQGTGGDIVLVSTKNVFAPGAKFGAYSATKAASHQLARIASLEMADLDVRVNMVSPDAVFAHGDRKSGLWAAVGPDRMRARGLDEAGLEAYYRSRNLLKAGVTARHVANAVLFFATRQTPTTGATIPVDGGLPDATPR